MQLKWPSESSVETFWPPLNSNYCTTLGYPMFKSQAKHTCGRVPGQVDAWPMMSKGVLPRVNFAKQRQVNV